MFTTSAYDGMTWYRNNIESTYSPGGKSFFPVSWSPAQILAGVQHVLAHPTSRSVGTGAEPLIVYEGVYNNVRMVVQERNVGGVPHVQSFYPTWNQ